MDEHLQKINYFIAAFLSSLSMITINQLALLMGIVLGCATFILNWVYKRKDYNLQVATAKKTYDLQVALAKLEHKTEIIPP